MSLADWVSEAVSREPVPQQAADEAAPHWEKILGKQLFAEVKAITDECCSPRDDNEDMTVDEAVVQAMRKWVNCDWPEAGASATELPEEERRALEFIVDKEVSDKANAASVETE